MDVPEQRQPDEVVLLVVHDGCEGEVVWEVAFDEGLLRRTGVCLGCGDAGVLSVV